MPGTRLRHVFDTPDSKRRYVRRLFSRIADHYDLITVVLSYGRDRRWKRILVDRAFTPLSASRPAVLDLACGTGDIALWAAARGGVVTGLDITPRMIDIARSKVRQRALPCRLLVGDMMALPFADASFDLVTTGYGLRNVPVLDNALREICRVLRPGGQLWSLDFDRPANRVIRVVYLGYLNVVGAVLGTVLHGDAETYRYIPASIDRYPGATEVTARLRGLGFTHVGHRALLGGLMAINYGTKGRPSAVTTSALRD